MGGSAGAVVTLPTPCENPRELAPGSGYRRCDNGLVHRPTVGVCPAYEAKSETFGPSMLPDEDECFMDADCDAEPLGFCVKGVVQYGAALVPNRCAYACTVDTECPSGTLCLCAEDRGTCTGPASCTSDADCTGAAVCAAFVAGCREPAGFSCQSSEDQCQVFSDCPSGLTCQALLGGPRRCSLPPCAG